MILSGREQLRALDKVRRKALDDSVTPDRAQEDSALCEAQLKKVVEWGKEDCPHKKKGWHTPRWRSECETCWQALLEEIEPASECQHKWVSMRNEVITSGEFCPKCNAARVEVLLEEIE